MKWIGIGTAVMALVVWSSAPMFGQERPGSSGQSPQGGGQAAPGSPGQSTPGSPGQNTPGSPRPGSTGQSTPTDRSSSQRDATPGHADAQGFVSDMTIANLAEVQLGKMANEKASNSDVKSFGQMMVKDHTQANNELKQIASRMNVQPPTQLDQKHKDLSDKLSKLSGAEFDREYINAMVMGHEEVLGKLRAHADAGVAGAHTGGAAADHGGAGRAERDQPNTTDNSNRPGKDPAAARSQSGRGATTSAGHDDQALTQWAAKTMPVVQKHLDRARDIQAKVAK